MSHETKTNQHDHLKTGSVRSEILQQDPGGSSQEKRLANVSDVPALDGKNQKGEVFEFKPAVEEDIFERITNEHAREKGVRLEKREKETRSKEIEAFLRQVVIGQPEACGVVARQVALSESKLRNKRKPKGIFYFYGPTGVGKTELPRALALYLAGKSSDDPCEDLPSFKTVNMGEFGKDEYVNRFMGASPGYTGKQEKCAIPHDWINPERRVDVSKSDDGKKERVIYRPRTTVLVLDEIDKAHYDVLQVLLSVFDKGTMTARNGEEGFQPLDFTNTYIFMTSNEGAEKMQKARQGVTFGISGSNSIVTERLAGKEAVEEHFKSIPEFLNRIPRKNRVPFNELSPKALEYIFDKVFRQKNMEFKKENTLLRKNDEHPYFPILIPTEEVKEYILSMAGTSFGGRPIGQLIESEIMTELNDYIDDHKVGGKKLYVTHSKVKEDGKEKDSIDFYLEKEESGTEVKQAKIKKSQEVYTAASAV